MRTAGLITTHPAHPSSGFYLHLNTRVEMVRLIVETFLENQLKSILKGHPFSSFCIPLWPLPMCLQICSMIANCDIHIS